MSAEEPTSNGATVKYTVRELFGQINERLDTILDELHRKADKQTVDQLAIRVDTIERAQNPQYANQLINEFRILQGDVLTMKKNLDTQGAIESYQKAQDINASANRKWFIALFLSVGADVAMNVFRVFHLFGQ